MSSHPDWYNNVYSHDWDYEAKTLVDSLPGIQGIFALQLLGMAAGSDSANFNDWAYNQSKGWEGTRNNWAGGGSADGGGDPAKYLINWPADSTTDILTHWFGKTGLQLPTSALQYWSMDNEPGIWSGTHDDVMPEQISADSFMTLYFEVAKKARAKFPDIRLVGPVATNEWQWYNWANKRIVADGREWTWLEYFIKRIGEEQTASGIRLLDVLDVHFYPTDTIVEDILQLHRVWFDTAWNYPKANGVKRSGTKGWDESLTREYLFARVRNWLTRHLGENHGVQLGRI